MKHNDDKVHPVQQAAFAYVGAFVDELVRGGLKHVCLCPGSRSTPLALTVADREELKLWTHIDERSAAFFALGLAKATRDPVALIATSGTAVANFLPAVTEAFFARVPLLLLTADRPHELRDVGTNQTLHQAGIFGAHVKWSVDMPLPEKTETMLRYVRTVAGRALATARMLPAGPVQLNFPFREPLIPLAADAEKTKAGSVPPGPGVVGREAPFGLGSGDTAARDVPPYVDVRQGVRTLPKEEVAAWTESLRRNRRPLIVCGPEFPQDAVQPVAALAARLQVPVLADPLSGLRTSGSPFGELIDAYDIFLRFEQVADALPPSCILRFGALPVSKPLLQYLDAYAHVPQIVVDEGDGWRDPVLATAHMVHADVASFCQDVSAALDDSNRGTFATRPAAAMWLHIWRHLNELTRQTVAEQLDALPESFEGHIFHTLAGILDGVHLFVGNSMPIRDMDAFYAAGDKRVRVFGNRGVSGIDGIVSSALGVGAASEQPLLLVLGDLSFYHDLNGLLAASLHKLDATIVVVNNDGGGIFSFLPQARHGKHFEKLFGTPTGLDFAPVVAMYGGTFTRTADVETLAQKVQDALKKPGLDVIEFLSDRDRNVTLHRQVMQAVERQLLQSLGDVFRGAIGGPT